MMRYGKNYKFGDILLAYLNYTDTNEIKIRPVLVLFEEHGNIVVAGITSNINMIGVEITKKEGMITDSIIKLNYIMTISEAMVKKYLLSVSENKKKIVKEEILKKIN